jgi:hypothetical protein
MYIHTYSSTYSAADSGFLLVSSSWPCPPEANARIAPMPRNAEKKPIPRRAVDRQPCAMMAERPHRLRVPPENAISQVLVRRAPWTRSLDRRTERNPAHKHHPRHARLNLRMSCSTLTCSMQLDQQLAKISVSLTHCMLSVGG